MYTLQVSETRSGKPCGLLYLISASAIVRVSGIKAAGLASSILVSAGSTCDDVGMSILLDAYGGEIGQGADDMSNTLGFGSAKFR